MSPKITIFKGDRLDLREVCAQEWIFMMNILILKSVESEGIRSVGTTKSQRNVSGKFQVSMKQILF